MESPETAGEETEPPVSMEPPITLRTPVNHMYNFGQNTFGNSVGSPYYYPYTTGYYPPYCCPTPGTGNATYRRLRTSTASATAHASDQGENQQENEQPQKTAFTTPVRTDASVYSYRVRIINPKNKREFMDLTWHNTSERFASVTNLKLKLIDCFPEYVPSSPTFQVGYLEGRGSQKRWIVCPADLTKMYDAFKDGDEIKLWCEAKGEEENRKRTNESREEEPKSKKEKNDEDEADISDQLKEKHANKYTGPQYTLWAKLIRSGRHKSYDVPPPIPLITGEQRGRTQKKETMSDVMLGAATAFAHELRTPIPSTPTTPTPSTPTTPTPSTPTCSSSRNESGLSPNNRANLRRKYLEDLRMLSELLNDGVLSSAEFKEQKDSIIAGLRKLKHS